MADEDFRHRTNARGVFKCFICDKDREIKCNIDAIEVLERHIYKRPLCDVLSDSLNGSRNVTDVVDLVYQGLLANKDTRLSRQEVGDYIANKGSDEYVEVFNAWLSYALVGEKSLTVERSYTKKK